MFTVSLIVCILDPGIFILKDVLVQYNISIKLNDSRGVNRLLSIILVTL